MVVELEEERVRALVLITTTLYRRLVLDIHHRDRHALASKNIPDTRFPGGKHQAVVQFPTALRRGGFAHFGLSCASPLTYLPRWDESFRRE